MLKKQPQFNIISTNILNKKMAGTTSNLDNKIYPVKYVSKPPIASGTLPKTFAFSILHLVWNTVNQEDILKVNESFLSNLSLQIKQELTPHSDNEQVNIDMYRLIMSNIFSNFYIQESFETAELLNEKEKKYHVMYIPSDFNNDKLKLLNLMGNSLFNDSNEQFKDVFWQHYNYYENQIYEFLLRALLFEKMTLHVEDKEKNFSESDINLLIQAVGDSFKKDPLYPNKDFNVSEININNVKEFFEIGFISMNPIITHNVLAFNKDKIHENIYYLLQRTTPEILFVLFAYQEFARDFYLYMQKNNMESTIYLDNDVFNLTKIIIGFFQSVNLYEHFVQIILNGIEKHKEATLLKDFFKNSLHLTEIEIH